MLISYVLVCVAAFVGPAYLTDRILDHIERRHSTDSHP